VKKWDQIDRGWSVPAFQPEPGGKLTKTGVLTSVRFFFPSLFANVSIEPGSCCAPGLFLKLQFAPHFLLLSRQGPSGNNVRATNRLRTIQSVNGEHFSRALAPRFAP